MDPKICQHWAEIEAPHGTEELCKSAKRPCSCCGDKGECDYPAELGCEDAPDA